MKYFVILLIFSLALSSWATYVGTGYIGASLDHGYGYGYGLSGAVHFKPSYSTSKPIYVNSWKPIYGYKPYKGHGSAYGYGYRPYYASSKPYYTYRPYYGYKPYYGAGSSYLYGYNPYYYGSYNLGLGHGADYTDWSVL